MSEAKNTPGPWADRNGRVYQTDNQNLTIANVARAFDGDYSPANARLIAAAPELLGALQEAVDCGLVPTSSANDGGPNRHSRQVRCADMIRASIAKATGSAA
jgi:hypothetical protein